jgi:hypothetical protein
MRCVAVKTHIVRGMCRVCVHHAGHVPDPSLRPPSAGDFFKFQDPGFDVGYDYT